MQDYAFRLKQIEQTILIKNKYKYQYTIIIYGSLFPYHFKPGTTYASDISGNKKTKSQAPAVMSSNLT